MTLNVDDSELLTIYRNGNETDKQLLKKLFGDSTFEKDIRARIQTVEDAFAYRGLKMPDPVNSDDPRIKAADAFYKLCVVIEALNEGRKPKYGDMVYYVYASVVSGHANKGPSAGLRGLYTSSRVTFAYASWAFRLYMFDEAIAEYAAKQFRQLYVDYFLFDESEYK